MGDITDATTLGDPDGEVDIFDLVFIATIVSGVYQPDPCLPDFNPTAVVPEEELPDQWWRLDLTDDTTLGAPDGDLDVFIRAYLLTTAGEGGETQ